MTALTRNTPFADRVQTWISAFLDQVFTERPARRYVDVRHLPDHIKRDIGVLDR